jgi:hypothetical protein
MSAELLFFGWFAVCLVGLFAYALGRRVGYKQGSAEALCEAPLRLRMLALQKGSCPVCNSVPANAKWYNERDEVVR